MLASYNFSRKVSVVRTFPVIKDIDDITRWREDMNLMCEWQEQYLTSVRSKQVRYCSCQENKIHIFELT